MGFLSNIQVSVPAITPTVGGTFAYITEMKLDQSDRGDDRVTITLETREEGKVTGKTSYWINDPTHHKQDLQSAILADIVATMLDTTIEDLIKNYPQLDNASNWKEFAQGMIDLVTPEMLRDPAYFKITYDESSKYSRLSINLPMCRKSNPNFKLGKKESWEVAVVKPDTVSSLNGFTAAKETNMF